MRALLLLILAVAAYALILDDAPTTAVQPTAVVISMPAEAEAAPAAWVAPTATPVPLVVAAANQPVTAAVPVRFVGKGIDAHLAPYRLPTTENPIPDPLPNTGATWSDRVLPGTGGNVVISAHNYALPALEHVAVGDVFEIAMSDGTVHRYRLFDRLIVQEEGVTWEQRIENGRWVDQHWPGQERLTIVTCWPFPNGTSHRLILIGEAAQ